MDENEIIFRIYKTTDVKWQLYHYHSATIPHAPSPKATDILEVVGEFFTTEYAQHIAEWKICSRNLSQTIINDISKTLKISIESLSLHREQELLCKGMFTELW